MTRQFNVNYTCPHCGMPASAETGFGRWMRAQPQLSSARGIVRTDTDHTILRYKTHSQGRNFQLLMDIEVKEHGSLPRDDQRDIHSFKHQMISKTGRNIEGSKTRRTMKLFSVMSNRKVNVRYLGFYLLRFENTSPDDSAWIEWDHKRITKDTLIAILAMDVDPYDTTRSMIELLRDRHKQQQLSFWPRGLDNEKS
jgi:hypothetical protein